MIPDATAPAGAIGRPTVSVVMPLAGDEAAARRAVATLRSLALRLGDQLILADNSAVAPADDRIEIVRVTGERSPAHARNVGAEHANGEWILFLDADCDAPGDLLDAFFRAPVDAQVGALAGEVSPAPGAATLAERYGAARSFLNQDAHLAHPYLPRAVAANLLVRRAAFEQLGGFYEGMRAAEDTDFCWRLQRAGWRLEGRPAARVEHRYRPTLRELRSQWRAYAAGRAWLARRYPGFEPEPALERAVRRVRVVARRRLARAVGRRRRSRRAAGLTPERLPGGHLDRYVALDGLLAFEELAGFALSNRPQESDDLRARAAIVILAERFPSEGDPLVEFVETLEDVRVEAAARPEPPAPRPARELRISYREDEGLAERAGALVRIVVRHPWRSLLDVAIRRSPGEPSLARLAPAALRLERDRPLRIQPLGGDGTRTIAARLAALTGIDDHGRTPSG